MDFNSAKQSIYGLAHHVCTNGVEQNELIRTIQDVECQSIHAGDEHLVTIKNMLNVINDGLMYGNWPWAKVR